MKYIITILSIVLSIAVQAQSIEKFSIDSGGASASAGGIEILYTIGEVNVQELSSSSISVSEGFINAAFKILIDPKVFLQGPILNPDTAGQMNDDLRVAGYIPTTSPYSDNASCAVSVFITTGPNAIVDWVWVELRAANDNTKIINAKSALLQRDGDIVALDGISNLVMTAAPTNYYVVIKHRNHLGAMSSQVIALTENSATLVDFKNAGFTSFGTDAQVTLNSGSNALWAGDANGDGLLNYSGGLSDVPSIRSQVFNDPDNSVFGGPPVASYQSEGYFATDIDMDGLTIYSGGNSDVLHIRNNIFNNPSNSVFGGPPSAGYLFTQQLPEGGN